MAKQQQQEQMEKKVKASLRISSEEEQEESNQAQLAVDSLQVRPHRSGDEASFYEGFTLRGIRIHTIRPGHLSCSFTVPPRLTDENGNLAPGAVASLVDEVGSAAVIADGRNLKVSTDMSISFVTPAKLHDELEIMSKVLGHKGGYSATYVLLRNTATGEVVAEGRHSLFGKLKSKI